MKDLRQHNSVANGSSGRNRQSASGLLSAQPMAEDRFPDFKRLLLPTLGLIIAGFVVVFVFGLFMPGRSSGNGDIGGAVLADQLVREGKVVRLENGIAEFETTFGERFMINPTAEGFRAPEVGSLQRVSLVPFRRSAENIYLARIRTIRRISEYSPQRVGGS